MIKLYSTGCPNCRVLKAKLDLAGIIYKETDDINFLTSNNIMTVPVVVLEDGSILNFYEALSWIRNNN